MKNIYTIRVKSSNPEYEPEGKIRDGLELDGYILLAMKDGEPSVEYVQGVTVMDLSKFFCVDTECGSVLRQAAAIAEGIRNAARIKKEDDSKQAMNRLKQLADIFSGGQK